MNRKPIVIIGVGNLLMTDEGVGCQAISYLEGLSLPANVELIDAASGGLPLMYVLENRTCAIIIDCADFGGEVGSVILIDPEKLEHEENKMISLHGSELLQTLRLAKTACKYPEKIYIIGVQPEKICQGMKLTDKVQDALPKIHGLINEILSQ